MVWWPQQCALCTVMECHVANFICTQKVFHNVCVCVYSVYVRASVCVAVYACVCVCVCVCVCKAGWVYKNCTYECIINVNENRKSVRQICSHTHTHCPQHRLWGPLSGAVAKFKSVPSRDKFCHFSTKQKVSQQVCVCVCRCEGKRARLARTTKERTVDPT